MILLLLSACGTPPIVDAVEGELAGEVLLRAETPLRLFVAISSVVAETCGVEDVTTYTFVGGGALALGATDPETTVPAEGEVGNELLVFQSAGLEDVGFGTLTLETPPDHASFDVTYTGGGFDVSGTVPIITCPVTDGDPGEGVVLTGNVVTGGTLEFTSEGLTTKVLAEGDKPTEGLGFSPPIAPTPTSGWAKWSDDGTDVNRGQALELDAAEDGAIEGGFWTGTASGTATSGVNWSHAVDVALP
jgi:hypothetical protein